MCYLSAELAAHVVTLLMIKSFNQELLSRFLCVGITITISKYQFVFIGEHVSSCVYVHTRIHTCIDIYCKYIVFIMVYTHTYI